MEARGAWTVVQPGGYTWRAAGEQGGVRRRRNHLRRRREVAGEACVERRVVKRVVGQGDARAELVRVDVLPHLVEPHPATQGQPVRELPFVRKVDAAEPAEQHAGIDGLEGNIRGWCRSPVNRQQRVHAGDRCLLHPREHAGTQRVRLVETQRAVPLDAVGDAAAVHVRRHSVEHEVADEVGRELNGAGAREIGELKVDVVDRFLQCKHPELVFLHLRFIDQRGREVGVAKGGEARR